MLSTAKQLLQMNLLNILKEAYMTQYQPDPSLGSCDSEAKTSMEQVAIKFAQKASGPVADAIYNFVKEIGINIVVPPSIIAPPLPPTLPGGPCSGAIPMTNITIS